MEEAEGEVMKVSGSIKQIIDQFRNIELFQLNREETVSECGLIIIKFILRVLGLIQSGRT